MSDSTPLQVLKDLWHEHSTAICTVQGMLTSCAGDPTHHEFLIDKVCVPHIGTAHRTLRKIEDAFAALEMPAASVRRASTQKVTEKQKAPGKQKKAPPTRERSTAATAYLRDLVLDELRKVGPTGTTCAQLGIRIKPRLSHPEYHKDLSESYLGTLVQAEVLVLLNKKKLVIDVGRYKGGTLYAAVQPMSTTPRKKKKTGPRAAASAGASGNNGTHP